MQKCIRMKMVCQAALPATHNSLLLGFSFSDADLLQATVIAVLQQKPLLDVVIRDAKFHLSEIKSVMSGVQNGSVL